MKGKIYGIFDVEEKDGEMSMTDTFFNNHFMWLFHIMNEIDGLACLVLGIPHNFIITIIKEKDEN